MKTNQKTTEQMGACETAEPAVGCEASISRTDAEVLAKEIDRPHVADILVWPCPEASDQQPLLRACHASSMQEAMTSAVEALAFFRGRGLRSELLALRPADMTEASFYYFALDELETWEHKAVQDEGAPVSMVVGTGAARGGRQRKPLTWERTLRNFVNDRLNRRTKTLGTGERSGIAAANNLSEGVADLESEKNKRATAKKVKDPEPGMRTVLCKGMKVTTNK